MPKSKKSSENQKRHYKQYQAENRHKKNKMRRLSRHCQHNPNDKQAAKALDKGTVEYTRNSFKHQKQPIRYPRLKIQPRDHRETIREQMERIVELIV